jgi:hypothetical protein
LLKANSQGQIAGLLRDPRGGGYKQISSLSLFAALQALVFFVHQLTQNCAALRFGSLVNKKARFCFAKSGFNLKAHLR